jgi:hypothetical protein
MVTTSNGWNLLHIGHGSTNDGSRFLTMDHDKYPNSCIVVVVFPMQEETTIRIEGLDIFIGYQNETLTKINKELENEILVAVQEIYNRATNFVYERNQLITKLAKDIMKGMGFPEEVVEQADKELHNKEKGKYN